jgi:hypothetical protein
MGFKEGWLTLWESPPGALGNILPSAPEATRGLLPPPFLYQALMLQKAQSRQHPRLVRRLAMGFRSSDGTSCASGRGDNRGFPDFRQMD